VTRNRIWLAGLVVALLVVAIASHGRAGHAWLPLLVLILAIGWLLVVEVRSALDALRREARRK
jgi:fatty acid desaturase